MKKTSKTELLEHKGVRLRPENGFVSGGQEPVEKVLHRVIQEGLRRCPRPSSKEEKAERIYMMCFAGGGSDTARLITHYSNLEEEILNHLSEKVSPKE